MFAPILTSPLNTPARGKVIVGTIDLLKKTPKYEPQDELMRHVLAHSCLASTRPSVPAVFVVLVPFFPILGPLLAYLVIIVRAIVYQSYVFIVPALVICVSIYFLFPFLLSCLPAVLLLLPLRNDVWN